MRYAVNIGECIAPAVLQHELEAADPANSLDRRWLRRIQRSAWCREQLGQEPDHYIVSRMPWPLLRSVRHRIQWSKDHTCVGLVSAGERETHHCERPKHIRILLHNRRTLVREVSRIAKRRAR